MELFTQALWLTLIAYVLFVFGKWGYKRFLKSDEISYIYYLSLKKNEKGECHIRIESPTNDTEVDITVYSNKNVIYTKNAHLKVGINKILLSIENDLDGSETLIIKSLSQSIERPFIEFEV